MKLRSLFMAGVLAAAGLAVPSQAHAALITGDFNFTLGHVLVSNGLVDFVPNAIPGIPNNPTATGNYGGFEVLSSAVRTGVFANAAFDAPDALQNYISDLSNAAGPNFVPVGPGNRPEFLQFTPFPSWNFTETFLSPGNLPGTPFNLTEQCGPQGNCNTSVTISIFGVAFDDSTPGLLSNWTAIISAQYTNQSIAQLQAIILGGGTLPDNAWSGTFSAVAAPQVPEPATLLTFGLGSMYLARRRRNQKKS